MENVIPGLSYIAFIVPGIIALTAMSGAIQGGLTSLQERLLGTMKEYLVAPIPRISILMGNALSTTTTALVQSIVSLDNRCINGGKTRYFPVRVVRGNHISYGLFSGICGYRPFSCGKSE